MPCVPKNAGVGLNLSYRLGRATAKSWLKMSDAEVEVEAVQEEQVEGELDIYGAIREVLKKAQHNDALVRGLNEAARAIDKGTAKVAFLVEKCELNDYKALIRALCLEHNVPLVKVEERKQLGEWAGLCRIDSTGTSRHVAKCSVAVVSDVDEESAAYRLLIDFINQSS